ncbi:ATP-binding cassette domain-containing protein [Lacisediminihabitans sp.]|uniref:ATP-binding cassette domain-containing protein n=1 Tax=Lacisediminihabitans sp. TaxID=2787631 RepID=UPI002F95B250
MESPPAGLVVSAQDVSIRYRANNTQSRFLAVGGVNLDIAAGEIVGLLGESGSGKSTLAGAIAGEVGQIGSGEGTPQISGGSLEVFGRELRGINRRRRDRLTLRIGYLRQDEAERLSPILTIAENVAEPIFRRDRKFNVREANAAVATAIDAVRLPLGLMSRLPHELSSGQRQRVALARALILEPALLVADEPTRGVDALVRDSVLDTIAALQHDRVFSALIVSSELSVVSRIASRVVVLQRGVAVGDGPIDEVLSDPEDYYVKGLAKARRLELSRGKPAPPYPGAKDHHSVPPGAGRSTT